LYKDFQDVISQISSKVHAKSHLRGRAQTNNSYGLQGFRKRMPLLIEFLVGITLKIPLKVVFFPDILYAKIPRVKKSKIQKLIL